MTALTHLFTITALLAGALAAIAIWSPRHLWLKSAALVTFGAFLPLAYAAFASLLSQPKPISLEWWHKHKEATLLASVMREGEGIDVWLQLPGETVPGAYTLPWSNQLAEEIQAAQRDAEGEEGRVRLRMPFERSWDDREPRAYAMPQPVMPPKDMIDPPPPMEYKAPEVDA